MDKDDREAGSEWSRILAGEQPSPLLQVAMNECTAILQEGPDPDLIGSFNVPFEFDNDRIIKLLEK